MSPRVPSLESDPPDRIPFPDTRDPEPGNTPVKIRTDEITDVIKREIEQFGAELDIAEVGRVVEVGDGMARVYGLSQARAGELIEFQAESGPIMGQVMNLEADTVAALPVVKK